MSVAVVELSAVHACAIAGHEPPHRPWKPRNSSRSRRGDGQRPVRIGLAAIARRPPGTHSWSRSSWRWRSSRQLQGLRLRHPRGPRRSGWSCSCALIETPPPLRDTLEPVPAMMEPLVEAALNTQLTPTRTATPTLGVVVAHAVGSLFASCCWVAWIDRLPAVNVVCHQGSWPRSRWWCPDRCVVPDPGSCPTRRRWRRSGPHPPNSNARRDARANRLGIGGLRGRDVAVPVTLMSAFGVAVGVLGMRARHPRVSLHIGVDRGNGRRPDAGQGPAAVGRESVVATSLLVAVMARFPPTVG